MHCPDCKLYTILNDYFFVAYIIEKMHWETADIIDKSYEKFQLERIPESGSLIYFVILECKNGGGNIKNIQIYIE